MHLGLAPTPRLRAPPHPPCLLVMPWVSPSLLPIVSPRRQWLGAGQAVHKGPSQNCTRSPPPTTGPAEGGVTDAPGWTRLCPRGGHLGQSLSRAEQSLEGGYEGRVLGQTMGPVRSNHSPQSLQRKQGGTQCSGWPLGSGP